VVHTRHLRNRQSTLVTELVRLFSCLGSRALRVYCIFSSWLPPGWPVLLRNMCVLGTSLATMGRKMGVACRSRSLHEHHSYTSDEGVVYGRFLFLPFFLSGLGSRLVSIMPGFMLGLVAIFVLFCCHYLFCCFVISLPVFFWSWFFLFRGCSG